MQQSKIINNPYFDNTAPNQQDVDLVQSRRNSNKIQTSKNIKKQTSNIKIQVFFIVTLLIIAVIIRIIVYSSSTSISQQSINAQQTKQDRNNQQHTHLGNPSAEANINQFSSADFQIDKQLLLIESQKLKLMVLELSDMISQREVQHHKSLSGQIKNDYLTAVKQQHQTQKQVTQSFYFFSVSIQSIILDSQLLYFYYRNQTIYNISLKQHLKAIIRTQMVHNINFKGEIQVQLTPFDQGVQTKKLAIRKIMDQEQQNYEQLYQLSHYNKYQLRFCLLVPSYNNVKSQLYLRNLDSIFMQDYTNYHVVYIDDASPDQTGKFVEKYVKEKGIPADKINVYINSKNQKAMYNIYNGIHDYCFDGEIVGIIDGDDSLLGRKVLQLYNAIYQSKGSALVYSNFLKILSNSRTSIGFGTEVTKDYYDSGKLRSDMSLVGSHFMTFFSDLFKKIKKQDFCYQNGTFYDYAYDRAIITPMIEMAFPRVEYLAQITYEYRNDTGINDGARQWQMVSRIILTKPAYQVVKQFPFIDEFIKKNKNIRQKEKQQQEKSIII